MFARDRRVGLERGARRSARLPALALLCLAAACGESPSDPVTDDPCSSVGEISAGQTQSGQLSTDDCQLAAGGVGDRWSLQVTSAMDLRIDLQSTAFDAYLELHSSSGAMIASNDDAFGLDSRISRNLSVGSYVVLVRGYLPSAVGPYSLSVTQTASCAPVGALTVGGTPVSGSLASSDCASDWNAPMDNWTLVLSEARRLRLDLTSAALDEVLLVRDAGGSIRTGADWTHPVGHARVDVTLEAGSWTVSATAPNPAASGAYTLSVGDVPPCTPGSDLVLGTTVSGSIQTTDCMLDGYALADSFAISLPRDMQVSVHVKSSAFTPFVRVLGGQGDVTGTIYYPTPFGEVRLGAALGAGSYAIVVGGYPPGGDYTLTVAEVVCSSPGSIAVGETKTGTLDEADCMRVGGALQESWTLSVPTDTIVRLDLTSTAFDAFLILRDTAGTVLASDDDGGGNLNARIQRSMSAGTYTVHASSFRPGTTGAYTLTAAAVAPSPVGTAERAADVRPKPVAMRAPEPPQPSVGSRWVRRPKV